LLTLVDTILVMHFCSKPMFCQNVQSERNQRPMINMGNKTRSFINSLTGHHTSALSATLQFICFTIKTKCLRIYDRKLLI